MKPVLFVLALLATAGAGLWWLKIHDFSVRLAIDEGVDVLRAGGPAAFFSAMAILPAAGFPMSVFYLTAGTAFAGQMGLPLVITLAGLAIAVNLALTYWLARFGIRPWLEQMISRTRYKIPVVSESEEVELTLLLRITPGPPYFVQGYLLGLAGVGFVSYMWISWVISILYATGFIIFGDAILHGKAKVAFIGLSILLAAGLAIHLLRRHYGKKRT